MGRSKKEKALSEELCIRLTKEQKDVLQLIADYAGLEVSDLVRSLITQLILKFKLGLPIMLPEVGLDEGNLPLPDKQEG